VNRARLEIFSDAVLAVAITLLALNLTIPWPGHGLLIHQLARMAGFRRLPDQLLLDRFGARLAAAVYGMVLIWQSSVARSSTRCWRSAYPARSPSTACPSGYRRSLSEAAPGQARRTTS
jgi:hypothetical protein